MNPNLFKSTEFYQRRYQNFSTLLILPLFVFLSFLLLFSLIAKKEVTVKSQGELTPTAVVARIQSTSNNKIVANYLKNGQLVRIDDILVLYDETMEQTQKDSLVAQLAHLRQEEDSLGLLKTSIEQGTNLFTYEDNFGHLATFRNFINQVQDLELGIAKANTEVSNQANLTDNTLAAINNQINQLCQEKAAYDELRLAIQTGTSYLSEGNPHQATLNAYHEQALTQDSASLRDQYLSQINQATTNLQASIDSLAIQRAGTGTVSTYDNSFQTKVEVLRNQFLENTGKELKALRQQISELSNQVKQADHQLSSHTIKATASGIIALNDEFEGKSQIPAGSDIATIYPDVTETKEVAITYYVDSDHVALLALDQDVKLHLEKIGNDAFVLLGKITDIAQNATKTEQGNLFKITARVSLMTEEAKKVKYGMQGRVSSIIAKKSYFDYYKDKLFKAKD